MAPSPPSHQQRRSPEPLEIPPPTSRFVLPAPGPSSDLLARLHAFLPQIKDANEQLAHSTPPPADEEPVVLEEISSESDESSEEETSSEEESQDKKDNDEQDGEGDAGVSEPPPPMERLLDIAARPKVLRKNLVTGTAGDTEERKVGIVELDHD